MKFHWNVAVGWEPIENWALFEMRLLELSDFWKPEYRTTVVFLKVLKLTLEVYALVETEP